jgi:N-acetylglucosamine kinase-like BadF-type ATPase
MSQPLFLGVDGGGTSTTAWLADLDGRVLGRGVAGPSNAKAIGIDAARSGLDLSIRSAFADAGLEIQAVDVACLGLAGFDRPVEKAWLEAWSAGSPWHGRLILVNDGDLVVAAGTPEGWGVGLIAGTGSIAVGRDREGRAARAGGWGYLFGDEGSAYAVSLAGLRKIARRADGRDEPGSSTLADRFREFLGIDSISELVSAVYRPGFDRAKIASMAPLVVASAQDDPSIFAEILRPAGMELANMSQAVARQLGFHSGPLPLAMAGSFLLNCEPVARVILEQLSALGYDVVASTVPHPVEGALILARRGWIPP